MGTFKRWNMRTLTATRRRFLLALTSAICLIGLIAGPTIWLRVASQGHRYLLSTAPEADIAIVFGSPLTPEGTHAQPFLAGRLHTAAQLVHAGKVKAVLVSGEDSTTAGRETEVMRTYLINRGISHHRIVRDPAGLDTYDTCRRARDVYGVHRALLVTQRFHLPRAVALCRTLGLTVDGVEAGCPRCGTGAVARSSLRELAAGSKAVLDILRDRPPAVLSPPDPALTAAVGG